MGARHQALASGIHAPQMVETVAWADQVMGKSFTLWRVSMCRGTRWERVNTHFCQFTKLRALLEPLIQEKNPKYEVAIRVSIAQREK